MPKLLSKQDREREIRITWEGKSPPSGIESLYYIYPDSQQSNTEWYLKQWVQMAHLSLHACTYGPDNIDLKQVADTPRFWRGDHKLLILEEEEPTY